MSFQDAVRTCLQQKYADFSGRARRSEYWYFALFQVVAALALVILMALLGSISDSLGIVGGILVFAGVIALFVPGLAVTVRRLHDTDKSGWWYLLSFVPFGGIVLLVFTLLDSTPDNRYGPNPKGLASPQFYQQVPPPAPQY